MIADDPRKARVVTATGTELVDTASLDWGDSLVKHRHGSALRHKRLFDGEEHSPDNYSLAFADESSTYYSPSHRHLWDQVRYCVSGWVPIGRTMRVDTGQIAYFPEGVRYGPQEGGPDRTVLVLQFGGASGNGYMSPEQTDQGRRELEQHGRFEHGRYCRDADGADTQQDAYEAIWEHVFQTRARYPHPVTTTPVVLDPDAFALRPGEAAGVQRRHLATFEPRGLDIEMTDLAAGSTHTVAPTGSIRLHWVVDGEGTWDAHPYRAATCARSGDHESTLTADTPTTLLTITIPTLGRSHPS
jgi:hypothetical protein